MISKVEHFLIEVILRICSRLFILTEIRHKRWSYKTGVSLRAIWSDCNKIQYLRLSTSRARARNRTAKWKTTASCLRA